MKIQIKDHYLSVSDSAQVLTEIEKYIVLKDLFLNYLVVDGIEVYDDFEGYLVNIAKSDSFVEVITLNQQEFLEAFRQEVKRNAEDLHQKVEFLANQFYSITNNSSWMMELVKLMESIIQLQKDAMQLVLASQRTPELSEEVLDKNNNIFFYFNEALEMKDSIYIADLLHFELKKWLESIIFMLKEQEERKDNE